MAGVRVDDDPARSDSDDALALLAQSLNVNVDSALDAVGRVGVDGTDRSGLDRVEDRRLEVVDVLERDPEDALEAAGLVSPVLVGDVQRVPGELVVHAEGCLASRQRFAHLGRPGAIGTHRCGPVADTASTVRSDGDETRSRRRLSPKPPAHPGETYSAAAPRSPALRRLVNRPQPSFPLLRSGPRPILGLARASAAQRGQGAAVERACRARRGGSRCVALRTRERQREEHQHVS